MTPIHSLPRTPTIDPSHFQPFSPSDSQNGNAAPAGGGHSHVSFKCGAEASPVNFGGPGNAHHAPQSSTPAGASDSADPMAQLMTLIQELMQRLQAMLQGNTGGAQGPGESGGGKVGGAGASAGHSAANKPGGATGAQSPGKVDNAPPVNGNFNEHSLGNQLSVQKSPQDNVGMVNDPERGNVIKVDFQKGLYTEHSTSPRAEIKDGTPLKEGQPYSFKFGMKRESNNDGTFFQVLDHNNAKPSPRAWLATKDGQYQLHLKTSDDSNAPSKVINIGKPGDAAKDVGKWADFQIDFKRGVGNGEITVSKNGQKLFNDKNISTMFNTHSSDSYAKFGQYRNEGDHKPAVSLFSGFSVAKH
ncbi:heparin lyase I family protein [Pseudomonas sp. SDO528_S397]